jgi:hypothetical protein
MSKMDAVIVDAMTQEGGLSLRRNTGERLSASALKTGLMDAGFKPGEEVVIISKAELSELRRSVLEEAAQEIMDTRGMGGVPRGAERVWHTNACISAAIRVRAL